MNCFKRTALLISALCIILTLSACDRTQEFERVRSFELNFLKEEYEEGYGEIEKSVALADNANYEIQVHAACESGTIKIKANYTSAGGQTEFVNLAAPCDETIALSEGTTDLITFEVLIDPETEGNVVVDVLSDN